MGALVALRRPPMNRFVLAAPLALPPLGSAAAGKNVESILSYWTDDAVIYLPGQEMMRPIR